MLIGILIFYLNNQCSEFYLYFDAEDFDYQLFLFSRVCKCEVNMMEWKTWKDEEFRQQRILKVKEDFVAAEMELAELPIFQPPSVEMVHFLTFNLVS